MSPLYRSFIGLDRINDLLENATRVDTSSAYPPYDIEKTGEDAYRISLAVAGFRPEELDVTSLPNLLVVSGRRGDDNSERERRYLHHGIAARAFERRFDLADHVRVKDARYEDGVLSIDLVREVPEALKPRRIEIATGSAVSRLEQADNQNRIEDTREQRAPKAACSRINPSIKGDWR
jgi:molecular chaperone IbpA